jgi:hypothetical protein
LRTSQRDYPPFTESEGVHHRIHNSLPIYIILSEVYLVHIIFI